jgi:hypothetical protein
MRFVTILTLAVLIAGCTCAVRAAEPPALTPLKFLLGRWDAIPSGKPGEASGSTVFAPSLQDRVIIRTNYADYPATEGKPAFIHDDLMVIYADAGSGVRADYYDNEGHVIRYAVQTAARDTLVFLSDISPSSPRFRITYVLAADSTLQGTFDIAPPGKPEAFGPYQTWVSRKAR